MTKEEQQWEYSGHGGKVKKALTKSVSGDYEAELQSHKDERVKKAVADLAEMMFVLGISPERLQTLVLMLFNYEVFDEFTIFRRDLMPEEIEPAVDIEHEPIILSPYRWPPRPLEAAEFAERLAKQWRSESEDGQHSAGSAC
jgi:hypothetical protein